MNIEGFFALIQTFIVLVAVILLANGLLKYLNRYMTGKNKIVKIIERVAVNKNSYISIVEICGKYYLMSFSENKNEILKELNEEEIKDFVKESKEGQSYHEMGKRIGKKISLFKNHHSGFSGDFDTTDRIS